MTMLIGQRRKFVTAFNDNAEPDVDVKSVEVTAEKTDLKVGDTTKAVAKVLPGKCNRYRGDLVCIG